MFAADSSSERATSILDYQTTCAEFISDISKDYMDWVDRYNLGETETARRKSLIKSIAATTRDWIFNYAGTIKKVDIVMNDGVNKMAENTAGYPFAFEIVIGGASRYVQQPLTSQLQLMLKAIPRNQRKVRVGRYQKDQTVLLNSSADVRYAVSAESERGGDMLNDIFVLDTSQCKRSDVISLTVVVEEFDEDHVTESRGLSTLIVLT
ncbi:MAG: hypothetical protein ABI361_10850 [Nitrososphaera sp.]|jgi:hypothetical protein